MRLGIIKYTGIFTLLTLILLLGSCYDGSTDINELEEIIYVRHKGADMPAIVRGNASEKVFLIILHGGPGGSGEGYLADPFTTQIEKNNAVVYYDQRGSGSSQGNYDEDIVNVELMADDVLALAKVIRAKYGQDARLFLMGHSWGGTLGPATLLRGQDEFAGWIDVDGAHDPAGTYPVYQTLLKKYADEQIALGNSLDHWNEILKTLEGIDPNYNKSDFGKLNLAAHSSEDILEKDGFIRASRVEDTEEQQNSLTSLWNGNGIQNLLDKNTGLFGKLDYTDQLKDITLPSLILWGKYDIIVPTEFAYEAHEQLGSDDKKLVIFEESGHSPMRSEPDLFTSELLEFINRLK